MTTETKTDTRPWTYEGYWHAVLGDRSPENVVDEFDLPRLRGRGLDEWLYESEAAAMGGIESPDEWDGFHDRALAELQDALGVLDIPGDD